MKTKLIILAAVLCAFGVQAQYIYPNTNPPVNLSFAWNASPSPLAIGYRLYWGATGPQQYTNRVDVGNVIVGSISNLVRGVVYRFAVTAYAADGAESPFSNEVVYQGLLVTPPSGLRIVVGP